MPQYAFLFTLTPGTLSGMIATPTDRSAAIRTLAEAHGGRLHAYYWMFGQWDGMSIVELPDSATAAAAALAVSSTGAFGHVETHELFAADELGDLLASAGDMIRTFRPPGAS